MGKRKSKTAKQNVARAAKRHSASFASKFGVANSRGIDHRRGKQAVGPVALDLPSSTKPKTLQSSVHIQGKKKILKTALHLSRRESHTSQKLESPQENVEQVEFEQQYRSLKERSVLAQKRRIQDCKSFTPEPTSFNCAPSTAQLVDATTSQIRAFDGLGSALTDRNTRNPEWTSTNSTIPPTHWSSLHPSEPTSDEKNPWAVLEDDSSDESDGVAARTSGRSHPTFSPAESGSFQFHPATFLVQSHCTANQVDGYDDPDL